MAWMPNA